MRKKIVIGIFIAVVLFLGIGAILKSSKISPFLLQLIFNNKIELKKVEGHINVLLLGIGGGQHEGPNLTDTMILASLNPSKNTVHIISIPRDLWIPELREKINFAYANGENRRKGGGIVLARAIVAKVLDQRVDYAVRIDFNGFVRGIDMLGGLDIAIDRTFDDNKYPDESQRENLCGNTFDEATVRIATESPYMVFPCRYQHVHFEKGNEHMDGKRVLIFVRSRYAEGEEGTDFARSNRQEKVIDAFKKKMFSIQTIFNPARVINLYALLQKSIDTNIQQDEFDDFIKLAQKMKTAKIQSYVIDYGDEKKERPGLVMNPPITDEYNSQWVLIPRIGNGNFAEIQNDVACLLGDKACRPK